MKNMTPIGIKLLASSVSTDETRFHLQGVYADQGKLVATDGHRMTVIDNTINAEQGKLYDAESIEKKFLLAEIKDFGRFPNWKQFNPDLEQRTKYTVTMPDQLSQFKSKKQHETRVYCYLEENSLLVTLSPIKTPGHANYFSVNGAYLKLLAGQNVDLYFLDSLSPIVFKNDDAGFTYVVMPMRF